MENKLIRISLPTGEGSVMVKTSPTRKEENVIEICLGLTHTTLRGIPLLVHLLTSLNQRILGRPYGGVGKFNASNLK
jgi:hypothetical protein